MQASRLAQSLSQLIWPPQCLCCGIEVASDFGLCGRCWSDTPFIHGLTCDSCGTPLPGEEENRAVYCDDCLNHARAWSRGRAVMLYHKCGRDLVLKLKYADREDLARPAALWLAQTGRVLLKPDQLIAPIPLHWRRLLMRRYNQAALLSKALAKTTGQEHCPDLLLRIRATAKQEGKSRAQRIANLAQAIAPNPRHTARLQNRSVLLIDDVFTSGATLNAAAEACLQAGAREVDILTLARVAKED